MIIKLKGEAISLTEAVRIYGKDLMDSRISEAYETFREDPLTEISWMDGMEIIIGGQG